MPFFFMTIEFKNEKIYINGKASTNAEKIGYYLLDAAEIMKSNLTIKKSGEVIISEKVTRTSI